MLAAVVDRALYEFERRTTCPATVIRAARRGTLSPQPGDGAALVHEIQTRRLRRALQYAYRHSSFYRQMFDDAGAHPSGIHTTDDLRKLPLTTSKDIHDWRRLLCVPEEKLSAVFTTSGTTGEPKRVYYTFRDMQRLTNLHALAVRVGHPGQLVTLIALPMSHGLWMGSATAQRVVERAGGLPIPVGADDPQETLRWVRRFEPNVIMSSPSHMTALTREAECARYRPKLEQILLGGEALTPDQKTHWRDYWGATIYDTYGSTETGGAQAIALPGCTAFHVNDFHLVTEIVNPETGEPDAEGELVFTTLAREAMPLVRYRSGDRGRWADCPCPLPLSTVQLAGRTDDMFVAGDMNLFGSVIADSIARVTGTSGQIALLVDKVDLTDRLTVCVEGRGVRVDDVRNALFVAYPEMRVNTANGNLVLAIEPDVDLGRQIKACKIVDTRRSWRMAIQDGGVGEIEPPETVA